MSDGGKQRLIRFALMSTLFVWAALSYAQLGVYMYKGILFARILQGRPYVSDFANHYNAAVLAAKCLRGEKVAVYNINVQNESIKALIAPVVPEEPFYLQYPPYFFALVLPLSLLPIQLAWLAWNIIGVILSILALCKLAKCTELYPKPREEPLPGLPTIPAKFLLIAFAFSSFPAWLSLELGQTSIYLVAAASFMLYFLKRRKYVLAGIVSGFLMVKLQYAPIFWIMGMVNGRSRFLAGWLGCMTLLILVSIYVLGPDNVLQYPQALFSGETAHSLSGVSSFMMQNLRGQIVLLLKDDSPLVIKLVLAAFSLAILAVFYLNLRVVKDKSHRLFEPVAALGIMIAILTSPHTHTQDYLLLSVCCVLLWSWLGQGINAASKLRRILISKILIVFPALSWLLFFLQPLLLLVNIQPFFLCLLILAILLFCEIQAE